MKKREACDTNRSFVESEDVWLQSTAHVALGGVGVVEESDLERNSALFTKIERLQLAVGRPVPNMDGATVVTWNTDGCVTGSLMFAHL